MAETAPIPNPPPPSPDHQPPASRPPPPVVIGGGQAGIVAALHLAERGLRPIVLEADPRTAGGRLAGGEDVILPAGGRDFVFPGEHGIHAIWGQYRNVKALLQRTGLYDGLIPARTQEWIYGHNGRVRYAELGSAVIKSRIPAPLHYLPMFLRPRFLAMLGPRDYLFLPAVAATVFLAVGTDPIQEGLALQGKTMADLMGDWSPTVRAFIGALARSGLSDYPQNVPLSGFIAFLRFYTLLRRDSQVFDYFPTDPVRYMIAPWVARITAAGGEVRLGVTAETLARTPDGWRVHWRPTGDETGGGALDTGDIVLALDSPAAARLLTGSPGTAQATGLLKWPAGLPTGTMRLWFGKQPRAGAEAGLVGGDFIIDNFFWLDRIQPEFRAWAAATGGSAIEVQIYGPPSLLLDTPMPTLLDWVVADVEKAYPEVKGSLLQRAGWVNPPRHTLFSIGPPSQHLGVQTPWPGLVACGDWVRHPAPVLFLERATTTALDAANAILTARGLAPWPIAPAAEPEALAQAIQGGIRALRRARRAVQGTG